MRRTTEEERAWIAAHYGEDCSVAETMAAFEREFGRAIKYDTLHANARKAGVRKPRKAVDWKGHPEYDERLREFAPGHTQRETLGMLDDEFGISITRHALGVHMSKLGLAHGTCSGRFEPGHVPASKGRRLQDCMPPESYERCKAAQFKRGHVPWNAPHVGDERVNGNGYAEVCVAESPRETGTSHGNWVPVQRLAWERANGMPVPAGRNVAFADGDRGNLAPDNLVLMTDAEMCAVTRYGLYGKGADALEVGKALAALDAKIAGRESK